MAGMDLCGGAVQLKQMAMHSDVVPIDGTVSQLVWKQLVRAEAL